MRPPRRSRASSTITLCFPACRRRAAARPAMPAPMTMTSSPPPSVPCCLPDAAGSAPSAAEAVAIEASLRKRRRSRGPDIDDLRWVALADHEMPARRIAVIQECVADVPYQPQDESSSLLLALGIGL